MSQEVYEVLQKSTTLDIWQPDDLEAIFHTRSVDLIIENEEVALARRLIPLSPAADETSANAVIILAKECASSPSAHAIYALHAPS